MSEELFLEQLVQMSILVQYAVCLLAFLCGMILFAIFMFGLGLK